jgi:hypothetical protein
MPRKISSSKADWHDVQVILLNDWYHDTSVSTHLHPLATWWYRAYGPRVFQSTIVSGVRRIIELHPVSTNISMSSDQPAVVRRRLQGYRGGSFSTEWSHQWPCMWSTLWEISKAFNGTVFAYRVFTIVLHCPAQIPTTVLPWSRLNLYLNQMRRPGSGWCMFSVPALIPVWYLTHLLSSTATGEVMFNSISLSTNSVLSALFILLQLTNASLLSWPKHSHCRGGRWYRCFRYQRRPSRTHSQRSTSKYLNCVHLQDY